MKPAWPIQRKALPLVLIAFVLLAIIIVKTRPTMQHEPREGFISSVNIISAKQYTVNPSIKGFGVVKPDIRFEADDYQSSLQQAKASSTYNHAKLNEIKVSIKNTRIELKLVKAKLTLAKKEFSRLQELLKTHLGVRI